MALKRWIAYGANGEVVRRLEVLWDFRHSSCYYVFVTLNLSKLSEIHISLFSVLAQLKP